METQKDAIEEREKRDKAARHQLDILDKTGQASLFSLICVHAFIVLYCPLHDREGMATLGHKLISGQVSLEAAS